MLRSTEGDTQAVARDITKRWLRTDGGEIRRGSSQDDTVAVTRNGVPAGEATPVPWRRFVLVDAAIAMLHKAPGVDLTRLGADLDSVASRAPTRLVPNLPGVLIDIFSFIDLDLPCAGHLPLKSAVSAIPRGKARRRGSRDRRPRLESAPTGSVAAAGSRLRLPARRGRVGWSVWSNLTS